MAETPAEVRIGWVCATSAKCAPLRSWTCEGGAILNRHLGRQLPDFDWHFEVVEKFLPRGDVAVDPLELLEVGCGEKIDRRWDFAFVVTDAELFARTRPWTVGVPSSALETAVISTNRFSEDNAKHSTRLAVLAQYLLGHLLGLEPHEPGAMRRPTGKFSSTPEDFDDADRLEVLARLREVADSRLEERRPAIGRLRFKAGAFFQDARGILRDVIGYKPWRQPFRLSTLTAAAFVSTLVLFLGAEAWELGVGMQGGTLAAGAASSILLATGFLYLGQNLSSLTRHAVLSEQLARSELVLLFSLLAGMASLWMILFLSATAVGLALPHHVISAWLGFELSLWHLARFAVFAATFGTLAGALGGNMEDENDFKAEFFFDEEV